MLGVIPAPQLPAARLRETLPASRPAHPSCLCLSCSTATLTAVFPLIRDGTSLRLATSSLRHHLFSLPLSGTKPSAARPALGFPAYRLPPPPLTSGNDVAGARCYFRLQTAESTLLHGGAKVPVPTFPFLSSLCPCRTNFSSGLAGTFLHVKRSDALITPLLRGISDGRASKPAGQTGRQADRQAGPERSRNREKQGR